jgi:hypothetical protein
MADTTKTKEEFRAYRARMNDRIIDQLRAEKKTATPQAAE